MTQYKPVKIMFDIDDQYQLKLYEHLKQRTNGSSYIRTLIHQDLIKYGEVGTDENQPTSPIISEPEIITYKEPIPQLRPTVINNDNIGVKITLNNKPINNIKEELDIAIEDLI